MIWRIATVALVAICVALGAFIYFRDRGPYAPRLSERSRVELDADRVLGTIAPAGGCSGRCAAEVLGRTAPRRWRVRLTIGAWRRCFVVSVDDFGYSAAHGVDGLKSIECESLVRRRADRRLEAPAGGVDS